MAIGGENDLCLECRQRCPSSNLDQSTSADCRAQCPALTYGEASSALSTRSSKLLKWRSPNSKNDDKLGERRGKINSLRMNGRPLRSNICDFMDASFYCKSCIFKTTRLDVNIRLLAQIRVQLINHPT